MSLKENKKQTIMFEIPILTLLHLFKWVEIGLRFSFELESYEKPEDISLIYKEIKEKAYKLIKEKGFQIE